MKIIPLLAVTILLLTSCFKKATCTCKNHAGEVQTTNSTRTAKKNLKAVEDACHQTTTTEYVNGTNYVTPCEFSS